MRYEGQYENGKRTGRWVGWHESGQMRYEGQYENGKRTGRWVEWGERPDEGRGKRRTDGARVGMRCDPDEV